MTAEARFSDRDGQDESLRAIAVEYVQDYCGTFLPILDARNRLELGYELEPAHIRLILNTMRSDPNVVGMPEPIAPVIKITRRSSRGTKTMKAQAPARRDQISLPMTVNLPYGHSPGARSASAIHVVDNVRSHMVWVQPYEWGKGYDMEAPKTARPAIYYLCDSSYRSLVHMQLIDAPDAERLVESERWHWCPRCLEKKLEREARKADG